MGNNDDGDDGGVTPELCAAYRDVIINQIAALRKDMEKLDSRTWYILTGIIISILLSLVALSVQILTRGL